MPLFAGYRRGAEAIMKKRTTMLLAALVMAGVFISGCGCGKEKNPAEQQVLKITVTPEPTATPVPEEVNPDAVVTSGGVTMVNEYLIQKGSTSGNADVTPAAEGTENSAAGGEDPEEGADENTADGE